ncbi:MAG: 4Fe-4S binding protein [Spirochaetes bacterium]|jgi:hypothetical protein|nr:4Fe-4S binding protein [Spirochaetota bacterium]
MTKTTKTNIMSWSWVFFISFFVLSIIDIRFALAGFLCMSVPLYHAIRGRGKVHCSKYCPRGSFLKNMIPAISLDSIPPAFMRSIRFKQILLSLLVLNFFVSLYLAGGDFKLVAMAIFRLMVVSSVLAMVMGIVYKPRVWCTVCPMGYVTQLISKKR